LGSEAKMRCHRCGTILRLWEFRCPSCHQSAMSWLHILVITAFAVTALFYLVKIL
jgi:RNA polymerase subunit RPABC4/transcription elongation factor Spt4